MKIEPWKKLSQSKFKGAYKTFLTKRFLLPNNTTHDFDIWYLPNGFVGVFALTSDMRVITATSYRPGPEKILQELPLGIVDNGEKPIQSAKRELTEETGYSAGEIITIVENSAWMPYADGYANFYLALNCMLTQKQKLEPAEDITVELIPLKKYVNNVMRKGQTSHSECAWLAVDYMLQNKIISLQDIY